MVTPRVERNTNVRRGRRTIKSQEFKDNDGKRYVPVCLYHAHPGQVRKDDSGCLARGCTHYSQVYFQKGQRNLKQPFLHNGESEDCRPSTDVQQ